MKKFITIIFIIWARRRRLLASRARLFGQSVEGIWKSGVKRNGLGIISGFRGSILMKRVGCIIIGIGIMIQAPHVFSSQILLGFWDVVIYQPRLDCVEQLKMYFVAVISFVAIELFGFG